MWATVGYVALFVLLKGFMGKYYKNWNCVKRVGEQHTLNCGVVVTIVEYRSCESVTVQDEFGNTKTAAYSSIKKGAVSWKEFGVKIKASKRRLALIGSVFTLSCGTPVTLTDYDDSGKAVLSDEVGNTRTVPLSSVRGGTLSWRMFTGEPAAPRKGCAFKVGDKILLSCGVEVVITYYASADKITITDKQGNSRVVKTESLKAKTCRWQMFKTVGQTPKKVRARRTSVGDRHVLNGGIEVTVLEVLNSANVKVVDDFQNSKFVDSCALRRGQVSWSEFGTPDINITNILTKLASEFPVGSVRESAKYGDFVIKEVNSSSDIVVEWMLSKHVQHNCGSFEIRSGRLTDDSCHGDYLKPTKGKYYVYTATLDGEVLYVGKGKKDRYRHVNTGISHVLELNRLFFEGAKVVAGIYKDNLTEDEALSLESMLIQEIKPRLNTVHNR